MPQLKPNEFKEAIEAYLSKVDGPSWNCSYDIEGYDRKISYSGAIYIFDSINDYIRRVFSIADLVSLANNETEISEDSAITAVENVLNRKRITTETEKSSESSASSSSSDQE